MTGPDTSFIAEMLRSIRADIDELKQDLHGLKIRQALLEGHMTNPMVSFQLMNERMARFREDMRLFKHRLELAEVP